MAASCFSFSVSEMGGCSSLLLSYAILLWIWIESVCTYAVYCLLNFPSRRSRMWKRSLKQRMQACIQLPVLVHTIAASERRHGQQIFHLQYKVVLFYFPYYLLMDKMWRNELHSCGLKASVLGTIGLDWGDENEFHVWSWYWRTENIHGMG